MIHYIVQSGQTLSGIAEQYGTSYQAIADASGISNPNVIYAGESIVIPQGGSFSSWQPSASPSAPSSGSVSATSSGTSSSSGGYSIPGMPSSLANCIAWRESNNGQTSWNIFQITPGSGFTVTPGMSVAQQEQVAGQLFAASGAGAWTQFDGC